MAATFGGLIGGLTVTRFERQEAAQPAGSPSRAVTIEQTSAIAEAAAAARPSVVRIESTKRSAGGVEQDVGSGVVLDHEGHIITNAHVVLGTDSLKVVLSDGSERGAILLGHDSPFTDIAVLQIAPGNLTPIETGDSDVLKLGESVIAIGNPLAEFDGSVSVGVVSGLRRVRTFDGVRQEDLIQTDAAVNNGNSGGALVNLQGQFVGMPTAVLRVNRGGADVEGIAFALPANRLLAIAKGIIESGGLYPRPSLQLAHQDITPEVLARFNRLPATEGALVLALSPNGSGDRAGIQPGDIISSINGQVVGSESPLLNVLGGFAPGDTVKVVLNRNGRIIETEVQLALRS
ncbi:MAG: trypsin-like peptidase domain-containing protein [Dehalococcoidia bacterium]|nr:trypsin-like peptidase domain-containing protein [Dehalococcoidia bacterium]